MKPTRLLTALTALVACGCTEPSSGPGSPVGRYPPEPVLITGTVVADASVSPFQVYLRLGIGERVNIDGPAAQRLVKLNGAEVQVRGTWTSTNSPRYDTDVTIDPFKPVFAITEFLVLAVGGRQAMDGVLAEDDGRYYLELTAGDVFWFTDVPSDLIANVGKRIWVTGSTVEPPLDYGVID